MSTILEYSHVTKQFGSMYALSDVSLTIEPEAVRPRLSSWPAVFWFRRQEV